MKPLLPFAFILLASGAFAQNETEPNNTPATANALTLGVPMNGGWCSGEPADVFAFTTLADGYLQVDFPVSHATTTINVYMQVRLLDASGTDVDGSTVTSGPSNVPDPNPFKLYCLAAGTYYLQVAGPANNECSTYALTAALVEPAFGNDAEDNDNSTQAQVVPQGAFAEGRVNYSYGGDNADWFRFDTPDDGVVQFDLDAFNQNAGTYVSTFELYDDALNSLSVYTFSIGGLFAPDTAFNTFTRHCLGQGTYYLRIASDQMCGLSYRLRWNSTPPPFSNDVEDNDTAPQASTLADGVWASGHVNYDTYSDNADWFTFDVLANGLVQIDLDAFNQNAGTYVSTFELYDSALNSLNVYTFGIGGLFQADTTFNTYTRYCLGQGTYYLRISSNQMCGLSYRVRCTTTPAPFNEDAEDNDLQADALPVYTAVQQEGHLNFSTGDDNADWYWFTVPVANSPGLQLEAAHQNGGTYNGTIDWFDDGGAPVGSTAYWIDGYSTFAPSNYSPGALAVGTYAFRISSPVCGLSYRFTMSGVGTVGVQEPAGGATLIGATPNPSTDGLFTILTNGFMPVSCQVMDASGRAVVHQRAGTAQRFTLDLSAFDRGSYTLQMVDAHGRQAHVRLMSIR
jgi:hypothetical protein